MVKSLDSMLSLTGWVKTDPAILHGTTAFPELCANRRATACVFHFAGGKVEKTYSPAVDVADYTELVLWTWSREKANHLYTKVTDYSYKVKINGTTEYYIECRYSLTVNVIDISSLTTISSIEFIPITTDDDYLVVSEMFVCKDQMPLDIMTAMKLHLEADIANSLYRSIKIGTLSVTAGQTSIALAGDYVYRYACIEITNGTTLTETHHIEQSENGNVIFTDLYSGKVIVNTITNADIYLVFPVNFGRTQDRAILPSINLWTMTPEFINRHSKLTDIIDSRTADQVLARRDGQILKYSVLIDVEAMQYQLIAVMQDLIKVFIGREELWVNGRKVDITFDGVPTEIEPTEGLEIIPKVQFKVTIEIKEELAVRAIRPNADPADVDIFIQ